MCALFSIACSVSWIRCKLSIVLLTMMSSSIASSPSLPTKPPTSSPASSSFGTSPTHFVTQGLKSLLAAMAKSATAMERRAPIFASAWSVGFCEKAWPETKSATVSPALAINPTAVTAPTPMPAGGGQPSTDANFAEARMPSVLPTTRESKTTTDKTPKESTCTPALTLPKAKSTTKSTNSLTDSSKSCNGDLPLWCLLALWSTSSPLPVDSASVSTSSSMCSGMKGTMKTSAKDGCSAAYKSPNQAKGPARKTYTCQRAQRKRRSM
mmetsp:Transcript_77408/g.215156  ORF Transcript_77408/g.215156 Transcript_77408/m.215156 type:complete len:267 (-) Transcript_77408:1883-2683(-)